MKTTNRKIVMRKCELDVVKHLSYPPFYRIMEFCKNQKDDNFPEYEEEFEDFLDNLFDGQEKSE